MSIYFNELDGVLNRTEDAVNQFMSIITPKIENAKDEHERLYWHHIYEEEEQRLDRLKDLIPKLEYFVKNNEGQNINNLEFIHLLQDISLEKFGLHNFEEHLDLALFSLKDTDYKESLTKMRDLTSEDYQKMKEILADLNDQYDGVATKGGSIPTDDKEEIDDHLKASKYVNNSEVGTP